MRSKCSSVPSQNHCKPVIVYDGEDPQLKHEVARQERNKQAERAKQQYSTETDMKKKKKLFATFARPSVNFFDMAKDMLHLFKVEYVQAPQEADTQLAYMYFKKQINAVVGNDGDYIALGIPLLDTNCRSSKGLSKLRVFSPPSPQVVSQVAERTTPTTATC